MVYSSILKYTKQKMNYILIIVSIIILAIITRTLIKHWKIINTLMDVKTIEMLNKIKKNKQTGG